MPEWHKIRAAIADGAASPREVAAQFSVVPETINAALRRMPDGEEQRQRMRDNNVETARQAQPEAEVPAEAAERLLQFAPHYNENPVPRELAALTARLLYQGVGVRPIAQVVGRPFYIIQGWAAQAGYMTKSMTARHAEIREAIECGAESLEDVADLTGLGRERVRQLLHSMPDREEAARRLGTTVRILFNPPTPVAFPTAPVPVQEMIIPEPEPAPEPKAPKKEAAPERPITAKERERLLHVIYRAQGVQRNATPQARRALTVRDEYVRKLYEDGVTIDALAEAAGVNRDSIRDWTSPAKTYRRQLVTQAIARKQRARRRS
jgi:bacterioferritin-associated ferredoxin